MEVRENIKLEFPFASGGKSIAKRLKTFNTLKPQTARDYNILVLDENGKDISDKMEVVSISDGKPKEQYVTEYTIEFKL